MKTPTSTLLVSARTNWVCFSLLPALLLVQLSYSQTPTIVSLGTLGGSSTTPYAVNAGGQVVGNSFLPGNAGDHAFIFSVGTMQDLGTLGGGFSVGYSVNKSGQVVGYSIDAGGKQTAFIYSDGVIQGIGVNGLSSQALKVNDAGQAAGNFRTANNAQHAFLFSRGTVTDLQTLGGTYAAVPYYCSINSLGWVVGESMTANSEMHAFLWKNGAMADLGTLGGTYSSAYSINASGWVTGISTLAGDTEEHAFLFNGSQTLDLGTLGGGMSIGYVVNNQGAVAGDSYTTAYENHAFLYLNGQMSDLGDLGGGYSTVYDLNNLGQVVGEAYDANYNSRAFLYEQGAMTDLNSLLPAGSGWALMTAYNISDGGHILGFGINNGNYDWFLLSLNRASANRPPVADAGPDQALECTGSLIVVQLDGSNSSDPDGDALQYEWYNGSTLLGSTAKLAVQVAQGAYTLTLKVTDPSGASAQDTLNVTVADTTPPRIVSLSVTPGALFPLNKKMVGVVVTATAQDNCDQSPVCRIVSISSNQPDTAQGGNTSPDWEITGPLSADLRAASAKTSPRVYTILVECTDASGNSSSQSVTVTTGK